MFPSLKAPTILVLFSHHSVPGARDVKDHCIYLASTLEGQSILSPLADTQGKSSAQSHHADFPDIVGFPVHALGGRKRRQGLLALQLIPTQEHGTATDTSPHTHHTCIALYRITHTCPPSPQSPSLPLPAPDSEPHTTSHHQMWPSPLIRDFSSQEHWLPMAGNGTERDLNKGLMSHRLDVRKNSFR